MSGDRDYTAIENDFEQIRDLINSVSDNQPALIYSNQRPAYYKDTVSPQIEELMKKMTTDEGRGLLEKYQEKVEGQLTNSDWRGPMGVEKYAYLEVEIGTEDIRVLNLIGATSIMAAGNKEGGARITDSSLTTAYQYPTLNELENILGDLEQVGAASRSTGSIEIDRDALIKDGINLDVDRGKIQYASIDEAQFDPAVIKSLKTTGRSAA